tara:strand:+ start:140 stop:796 length:657 start_codon:yes stop_codon:yes gene_type:complete
MQESRFKDDELGSIGIGAMIVFIALILVAAVASAVIIQTGEKLQQNAQQSGDDTQREISGKITINSVFIVSNDLIRFYIESAPGSGVLAANDIAIQITCDNQDSDGDGTLNNGANDGYQFIAQFASDADGNAEVNEIYQMSNPNDVGAGGTEIVSLLPGENYMIDIVINTNPTTAGADCDIGELGVNGELTTYIHVQGGGSSYETLYISSTAPGTALI